jgi:exopolysaccharide biosynthesis polyprenyl glycosylphosphotransferase
MILAFCIQVLGTVVITLVAKNIMIRKIVPSKTLIILGRNISEDEGNDFRNRVLHKYSHLFNIVYVYSELDSDEAIKQSIKECDTVFLYEIQSSEREKYMIMCMEQGVDFYFSPNLGDILCQGSESKHIFDTPIYKYKYGYKNGSLEVAKRIFDVTLSIILLIISLPISIFIAIVIKVEDGGPIYYIQERVTKDGKRFKMIKFRSMIVDAEKVGAQPCSDGDSRITRVGRWIRATRLDELPQFINILKGDMSLVGPRPERVEHVTKYTEMLPEFSYRLRVKGGLTGYAQVYGKYNTTPYDKLRLDLMYIENQSILLDLKIIALTIKTIFSKESTEGFQIDEKTKQ